MLEAGGGDDDIDRMLRRRELVPLHPGVYVDHNGPLTLRQRAWAAVLARWPAALARESALGEPSTVVHLAVDRQRNIDPLPGTQIHRTTDFTGRVEWHARPPQVRTAEAVIDTVIARLADDDVAAAFAVLTRACFRRTSVERVARALEQRSRVPHRRLIEALVDDLRSSACSVLERGYLHRVERAHGLPRGTRQRPSTATGRRTHQDVRYESFGTIVELDGRSHTETAEARDADARRDLAELAVAGAVTGRVTYGLVFGEPCATARRVAAVLQRNGWTGQPTTCPRCR